MDTGPLSAADQPARWPSASPPAPTSMVTALREALGLPGKAQRSCAALESYSG